ncbi:CBS domain-containing protein [Halococcus thailandensis]|nr:CBS domain-containing protein [Halococcus thailandensis]
MSSAITVREIMTREFLGVSESDDLLETVELLLDEAADCAVVLRGPDPVGALDERDALSLLVGETDPAAATVTDVMDDGVVRVASDASLTAAAEAMAREEADWLLVVEDEPVGVVSAYDIATASTIAPVVGDGTVSTATEPSPTYDTQGICEHCGTLTHDLVTVNGQSVCANCREN